jgi:hypothetical protein
MPDRNPTGSDCLNCGKSRSLTVICLLFLTFQTLLIDVADENTEFKFMERREQKCQGCKVKVIFTVRG